MARYRYLLFAVVISSTVSAQEAVRKKVVSVGTNNASLVAKKIRHTANTSLENRLRYLIALYQSAKPGDAVRFFKTIDNQSVTKRERMIYIRCLLDLGRAREAYVELRKVDNPRVPDVKVEMLRAKIFIRLKEWKAARATLEMVLRVAPNNPEAHYYFALTCPSRGDYKGTVKHCNAVWELTEPNSKIARLAGALMLVTLTKIDAEAKKKEPAPTPTP